MCLFHVIKLYATVIIFNFPIESSKSSDEIFNPSRRSFFEGEFEQKLDHFNASNSKTFNQVGNKLNVYT